MGGSENMTELLKNQTCPYCGGEVEDCHAVWEENASEEIKCDSCRKTYVVKPQFKFEGFLIEKQCEKCGEWSDDGMVLCDCDDQE
jgi:hypothetical protein